MQKTAVRLRSGALPSDGRWGFHTLEEVRGFLAEANSVAGLINLVNK